jgi:hypothetical protein
MYLLIRAAAARISRVCLPAMRSRSAGLRRAPGGSCDARRRPWLPPRSGGPRPRALPRSPPRRAPARWWRGVARPRRRASGRMRALGLALVTGRARRRADGREARRREGGAGALGDGSVGRAHAVGSCCMKVSRGMHGADASTVSMAICRSEDRADLRDSEIWSPIAEGPRGPGPHRLGSADGFRIVCPIWIFSNFHLTTLDANTRLDL